MRDASSVGIVLYQKIVIFLVHIVSTHTHTHTHRVVLMVRVLEPELYWKLNLEQESRYKNKTYL